MAKQSEVSSDISSALEASGGSVTGRANAELQAARRVEALSLRIAGFSHSQIAERLGISPQGVSDLISRSLDLAENRSVDEMRALEGARIDRAQSAIWAKVLEGDLKAVEAYTRLSARRSKLFGLDAPTRIDMTLSVKQEMEMALKELENVILGEVVYRDDEELD